MIEEGKVQRMSSKKYKNVTSRSPKSKVRKSVEVRASVEVRKNITDRSDSRLIMKRNISKKEDRSVATQYRNKS